MPDKIFGQLRLVFIVTVVLAIVALSADVLYTSANVTAVENPALERWAIIITLFGIFGALKLLHPRLKNTERTNKPEALKKYAFRYYLRLFALLAILIFNIACLHFTGAKNFIFLGIITIFALFFCVPNKENMEDETRLDDDQA